MNERQAYEDERRRSFTVSCPNKHTAWQTFSSREVREQEIEFWCQECEARWRPPLDERKRLLAYLVKEGGGF